MHTKMNTHQNDSNFLTHGLWSKTKLGMQHIHLEPLHILRYAITKKIKNISRTNICDKYKIGINSLEVHLDIKRSHVEVEHKNLFYGYKNHLDGFSINTKQFIINDLQHNFVQFLVQKLGKITHNIYKIQPQSPSRF
jgi:hypothetical protein